jgi:hypothetical protein
MHLDSSAASARTGDGPMDLNAVRDVSRAVSAAHLFIYLAPESAEEAARLGVTDRGPAYLAFRSAAMGAVPWQVTLAAFYNFSPRAVKAMAGVWDAAPPEQWQAARFLAAGRAMRRVNVPLTDDHLAQARSLIAPVVADADYAGKVLAAANASVALPTDPLVALWQQITVAREWRDRRSPDRSRASDPSVGRRRVERGNGTPRRARLARLQRCDHRRRQCGTRAHRSGDGRALRRAVGADRQHGRPPLRLAHRADHQRVHRSRDVSGCSRMIQDYPGDLRGHDMPAAGGDRPEWGE